MKKGIKLFFPGVLLSLLSIGALSCQESDLPEEDKKEVVKPLPEEPDPEEPKDYKLPDIDLSHWKVTLPIGKPLEVSPPEILDYATNEVLRPFFFNDSIDGSLVFYTYPEASTQNSSYSRTELREQMVPGRNDVNWTFKQGGKMKGTLSVPEVSKNAQGKPDRVMVMQIHGRLTNEQRDLIGEDDNNAPPIVKVYWDNGFISVRTKVLKDLNASDTEILPTNAWGDDKGHVFSRQVGTEKFTLEIIASDGKVEVIFDEKESVVYDSEHMRRWNLFENYFKAGNYLMSTDKKAFSKVKYYKLEVTH